MIASRPRPNRRCFVAAVLGSLGSLTGCGKPTEKPSIPGTRIPYGSATAQFGDLRLPGGSGPHPVIVAIHGGFWRHGYDLAYFSPLCEEFARNGWATWNIEYRGVGANGGGWPGTFLDVAAATDHLRELAGPHSLDLSRVVTVGHSAGGHLALWTAARHKIPAGSPLHRASPLPIKAAVSLAGVADLRKSEELKLGGGAAAALVGGSPQEVPDRYAVASPAELLPFGVPQTLIHGTNDSAVPISMSEGYQALAVAKGDSARLVALANGGHFGLTMPHSHEWPQVAEAIASCK
jgi:acetyl esterase/lipase